MASDQKIALVTGANAGLGFETAKALYLKGFKVIADGRNLSRLNQAISTIAESGPGGELISGQLDLSSLKSIKSFADQVIKNHQRLDLLINNAGVMVPPASKTIDGYELQFGVNFVGHFSLTGQLFPVLESTFGARVVTLSSLAHRNSAIDFNNFRLEKPYEPWREYGQSKLADLIFALEFARRLEEKKCQLISLAAHPGFSKTELQKNMDKDVLSRLELMTAEKGAQPTLVAALSDKAKNGQYWGPDGPNEQSGNPAQALIDPAAQNLDINRKLFNWAQETLNVSFP